MDGANQVSVGIDVAKATLDLHLLPAGQAHHLPNTAPGYEQLRKVLPNPAHCLIVLEATGGYEREVVADLTERYSLDDLRASVSVPTLFSIPRILTASDTRRRWRNVALTTVSIVIGLALVIQASRYVASNNEQLVRLTASGRG